MTSGLYLGGDKHTDRSLHRGSTHDYLPQFHPHASTAYPELAPSVCPPQVLKRPQSVARSARKSDRALFPAIRFALKPAQLRDTLLNVLLVGGAIGLIVTVAAAAFIAPYILFFVET